MNSTFKLSGNFIFTSGIDIWLVLTHSSMNLFFPTILGPWNAKYPNISFLCKNVKRVQFLVQMDVSNKHYYLYSILTYNDRNSELVITIRRESLRLLFQGIVQRYVVPVQLIISPEDWMSPPT